MNILLQDITSLQRQEQSAKRTRSNVGEGVNKGMRLTLDKIYHPQRVVVADKNIRVSACVHAGECKKVLIHVSVRRDLPPSEAVGQKVVLQRSLGHEMLGMIL